MEEIEKKSQLSWRKKWDRKECFQIMKCKIYHNTVHSDLPT